MIWKLIKWAHSSALGQGAGKASTGEQAADLGPPEGFVDIPQRPFDPKNGDFQTVWRGLLELEHVFFPVFLSLDSASMTPETARPIRAEDLEQRILYVQNDGLSQGALQSFNVIYSDPRLLESGTMCQRMKPEPYLEHVLFDPNTVGLAFNPPSRVMKRVLAEDTLYINKVGVAELIGFLQVGCSEPEGTTYCELAKEAFGKELYYQTLYYWAKCFRDPRPGDDWQHCYLEKLKSYHALDFPGARERAANELAWYINEHGGTIEHSSLMASWGIG